MSEIQPPPYRGAQQPPPYQPAQPHPAPDVVSAAWLERIAGDVRAIRQWVGFWSVLGVIGIVLFAISVFSK